ncbi:hypothetical protein OIU78_020354 [Salix suchowensis]|nr:hypothetical protein OIU78_020354 [Salix suchowensis]
MKRASLGRSMFRSEHIRSYKAEVDNEELTDKRQKSEDSSSISLSWRQVSQACMDKNGVLGFLESQENFPFTSQGVFLIL